jgi:hypothetical protein
LRPPPRGVTPVSPPKAEWQALHRDHGLPLHIFRLAGIYGPGRGPFEKVQGRHRAAHRQTGAGLQPLPRGGYRAGPDRLDPPAEPGPHLQHLRRRPGAAPQDVIAHAAELLGLPHAAREIPFEKADLSPMARSFYAESKRVSNDRIKDGAWRDACVTPITAQVWRGCYPPRTAE